MKHFAATSIFNFSWDQVCIGFFQRYNLFNSKHIMSEDVVYRQVEDGKLVTRKLIKKTTPRITKLFFLSHIPQWTYVIEESVVDPINKVLTSYTRNIALKDIAVIDEKCVYTVDPAADKQVQQEKWAWIDSSYGKMAGCIREVAFRTFKMRAGKSNGEFIAALNKIFPTEVHPVLTPKEILREKAMKASKFVHKAPKTV